MTRKELNKRLADAQVHADRASVKRDGTIEVMHSFFYRHGRTAESWANTVRRAFPEGRFSVAGEERWAVWPKTSYFVAVVTERKVAE